MVYPTNSTGYWMLHNAFNSAISVNGPRPLEATNLNVCDLLRETPCNLPGHNLRKRIRCLAIIDFETITRGNCISAHMNDISYSCRLFEKSWLFCSTCSQLIPSSKRPASKKIPESADLNDRLDLNLEVNSSQKNKVRI